MLFLACTPSLKVTESSMDGGWKNVDENQMRMIKIVMRGIL